MDYLELDKNLQELAIQLARADKELGVFRDGLRMPGYKDSHLAEIRDEMMKIVVELRKLRTDYLIVTSMEARK